MHLSDTPYSEKGLVILTGQKLSIPDQEHFLPKKLGNLNGHEQLKEQGMLCQPVSQTVGRITEWKELTK